MLERALRQLASTRLVGAHCNKLYPGNVAWNPKVPVAPAKPNASLHLPTQQSAMKGLPTCFPHSCKSATILSASYCAGDVVFDKAVEDKAGCDNTAKGAGRDRGVGAVAGMESTTGGWDKTELCSQSGPMVQELPRLAYKHEKSVPITAETN
ncbi:hypothetical protein E2C01_047520 [Portunus trituberculatus]|uniref:Uncharacterized protein n=1 Tax=Portunus trituberculatus TaxID=210409 RepID=A0A5B7G7P6_PORTR|nr:hypothetical protein [Portunus trituberculatus]